MEKATLRHPDSQNILIYFQTGHHKNLQHQQVVVFQGGYVMDVFFWSPVLTVRLPGNQCTSPSATTKHILATLRLILMS